MSFKVDLKEEPEVDWPITICVPADGGKVNKSKVTVRFKLLDGDKLRGLGAGAPAYSVLKDHVIGLGPEFIDNDTGKKLEFTPEILKALVAKPWIQRAFSLGLIEASSGAAAKNS